MMDDHVFHYSQRAIFESRVLAIQHCSDQTHYLRVSLRAKLGYARRGNVTRGPYRTVPLGDVLQHMLAKTVEIS